MCEIIFSISNGVKPGGVISPIMFNLYLDNLLNIFKQSGIGCHINDTYMSVLVYADDITLICPSLIIIIIIINMAYTPKVVGLA